MEGKEEESESGQPALKGEIRNSQGLPELFLRPQARQALSGPDLVIVFFQAA